MAERLIRAAGRAEDKPFAALAGPGLTRRELQIALLASSGLSSKDIAAKLQLSVRTIDNHLGHVYAKLGISGRNELASRFEYC
jgi:DNA-binding CsgD family transcriptional regulator